MRKWTAVLAVLSGGTAAGGGQACAAAQAHAQVETKVEPQAGPLALVFKVVPEGGLHINQEGPWQLELTPGPGLSFAQTQWKKTSVDFAVPGFRVLSQGAPTTASGTLAYKLTAFVCTDDKAQCYRDVLSGQVAWKK